MLIVIYAIQQLCIKAFILQNLLNHTVADQLSIESKMCIQYLLNPWLLDCFLKYIVSSIYVEIMVSLPLSNSLLLGFGLKITQDG